MTCDHCVFIKGSRLSPYKAEKGKLYVCELCYSLLRTRTNGKKITFVKCPDLYKNPLAPVFKGEQKCKAALLNIGVNELVNEFFFQDLPQKRYDFKFKYDGHEYILEFDGDQHFKFVPCFHKSELCLEIQKSNDIKYTREALKRGVKIIRIDIGQLDHLEYHIINALRSKSEFYLSNAALYKHF